MENLVEASFQQFDLSMIFVHGSLCYCTVVSQFYVNWEEKVLVITMAVSFGIDDYIEGGVIAAVILLNIVVG